jgi:ABC-type uncharacterized transport system ATPase subunit
MSESKQTPEQEPFGWEAEYSALHVNKKVMLQLVAERFGVPLIAAFYRAKDLGVFDEPSALSPPTREEGVRGND